MTEEIKNGLSDELKKFICSMKKASIDDVHAEPMSMSDITVVNFDKIPREYSRGRSWKGVPKSNDALYVDIHKKWYFIEFKNGEVKKGEIYRKLYDSIIMLLEWGIIPGFDFIRNNVTYILVYNSKRYHRVQPSPAREETYKHFMMLADEEEQLFDIDKFEDYLFERTHTYTKEQFERFFVLPMEQEEQQNKKII